MKHHDHDMIDGVSNRKEYIKFAFVIAGILAATFWIAGTFYRTDLKDLMEIFMGVFFVTFAAFKLIGYKMFVIMFPTYDIIAARSKFYAQVYPFFELVLGLAYLLNFSAGTRDYVAFVIMSIGLLGVWRATRRSKGIRCACLGNVIRLPLGTVTLIEDALMAAMALYMILA